MKYFKKLLWIFVVIIIGCKSEQPKKQTFNKTVTDSIVTSNKYYSIKSIIKKNAHNYIIGNMVELYFGEEAIKVAKKAGDAQYDISASGDTIYYLENDIYLSNSNHE
ncbi:MAG: hypothetical protein JKZ00_06250, partial [Flavobacteriaceae bacterium]|nr:hypothetical protein [Flavobacteriaceae bacterium]